MFYINRETELNIELLQKMLKRFKTEVKPKLQRYKDYYDGKHDILQKKYSDKTKKCSHIITNFTRSIADAYAGYIASPGFISYSSQNDISDIMDILRYNDFQAEDSDFLLNALVYGTAAELMYIDDNSKIRFRQINPLQCFGVYDDTLSNDLLYFVRFYPVNEWDEKDEYEVDVYSDYDIKRYTMNGENGNLTFIETEQHYFSQCPANLFSLADERSIFDCILPLQDAYNEAITSEVDEYSDYCNSYLGFFGVELDEDDAKSMRENRILIFPTEGATAQWITKNANDTQIENILKRLHDSIYRISSCVDFSSESLMSGIASGISIRYKMCGQEQRAATIAASMKKALQRRIEIICGIATLKYGEEIFRDIDISFKRNIPEDITATISLINSLKGSVSDATLLSQLPFIDDVNEELEAVETQKKRNIEVYSFAPAATETEDEE